MRRLPLSLLIAACLSSHATAHEMSSHAMPSQSAPAPSSDPAAEAGLLSQTRQLILSGKRSGEGYFSADGRQMIFQSEREPGNPFFQMYLLDFDTGETTRVSPGSGKTTCGWIDPRGQGVMFSSTHADPNARAQQQAELDFRAAGKQRRYSWDYDPHYEIYSAAPGQPPQNLSKSWGYDAEGAYSPDGSQIVFASNRQAYTRKLPPDEAKRLEIDPAWFMDLYIMDRDGGNVRQLTQVPGYDGGPFFSPDGQRVVFRRFNAEGDKAEIWSIKTDGSDSRQLTRLNVLSWAPYYHPSGDYLIFATNQHGFGNFELYLVDAEGKQKPVRVTHTEGFDGLPVFSPDGQQLSWTSGRTADSSSQIFIAKWNDAEARRRLGLPATGAAPAATTPAPDERFSTGTTVSAADLRRRVEYLASPALEGRMTGSAGEKLATDYAAEVFRRLGLQAAGEGKSYFQDFRFTAGVELGTSNQLQAKGRPLALHTDWLPLSLSASGKIDASEVVFAGYGLRAPANGAFKGYDSYVHLDVKDKWVMVLRYWPEQVDEAAQQELKRYSALHYKLMLAREQGAKGLIVVSGPNSPDKADLIPFRGQGTAGSASLPAISLSNNAATAWFKAAGQDLQAIQTRPDSGEFVQGFDLKQPLSANLDLRKTEGQGRNVLAKLNVPGATRTLVIGAHLDHLGKGPHPSSLAAKGTGEALIHFGADDNASGSAGVLELAEALKGQPAGLKQNILFALWSGEEMGLLGSNHFVAQYAEAEFKQHFSAYLNMDMVGRLDKALVLQGTGSSPVWTELIEKHNLAVGLPLTLQQSAYLPTDATSFYLKGIPALSAFTGAHKEYHTPADTPEKLNYEGTAQIVELLRRLAVGLASNPEAPAYTRQEPPRQAQSRGLRVYLGTIPDYAGGDIKGMPISGVAPGGPAEQAGLKAGDLIVELNGKGIENIYDYTYAIDTLTIGKSVSITVLRQGQRLTLSITPGARN
ncbi:MAG: peptidase M28 [Candidatus Melainabacteria bacterium HGW-Melainabacteria-1]|nr:MAG: peptidase M28 [Candidatus Melainabacteria bacterium HGW-Melainabacteria-1]